MNNWFKDGPSNGGYHFEVRKHTTLIMTIDYELLI